MVLIIWDSIMCEGLEVILRIAVSILLILEDSLLAMHHHEILTFLDMMKTDECPDGGLNASRIGQLMMEHMALIEISPDILDALRNSQRPAS